VCTRVVSLVKVLAVVAGGLWSVIDAKAVEVDLADFSSVLWSVKEAEQSITGAVLAFALSEQLWI
jgi:hypothetical protein